MNTTQTGGPGKVAITELIPSVIAKPWFCLSTTKKHRYLSETERVGNEVLLAFTIGEYNLPDERSSLHSALHSV